MAQVIISTLLQLGIVVVLAGIVWLIFGRGRSGFAAWLGLTPAPARALFIGAAIGLATAAALLAIPGLDAMAGGERSVAGEAARQHQGAALWLTIAIVALIKTALSEELLFRGLIGKRLIARLGFAAGNMIQAVLFGLVHLLLLLVPTATAMLVLLMVVVTGLLGWVSGWLNERLGGGSILPGWVAHGAANLAAYGAIAAGVI